MRTPNPHKGAIPALKKAVAALEKRVKALENSNAKPPKKPK